ncbi:MAG: hypothetical protein ACI9JM_001627 [Halioglobus sp.]|jgi:hypothetical protein
MHCKIKTVISLCNEGTLENSPKWVVGQKWASLMKTNSYIKQWLNKISIDFSHFEKSGTNIEYLIISTQQENNNLGAR